MSDDVGAPLCLATFLSWLAAYVGARIRVFFADALQPKLVLMGLATTAIGIGAFGVARFATSVSYLTELEALEEAVAPLGWATMCCLAVDFAFYGTVFAIHWIAARNRALAPARSGHETAHRPL